MSKLEIAKATREDGPAVYAMVKALAELEGAWGSLKVSEAQFVEQGFGAHPRFHALIARQEGRAVGMATYLHQHHIWSGRDYIEIDDLYVVPDCRSQGIGEALMRAVAELGQDGGFVRWGVLPSNHRAIAFYKGLGASYLEKGVCRWEMPLRDES